MLRIKITVPDHETLVHVNRVIKTKKMKAFDYRITGHRDRPPAL